ncbi:hypothetical protein TNCV_4258351 [Trichonephila clavipes]|nr:hypothetical protein TNCV_4258351 [Trichonephila clavipes]
MSTWLHRQDFAKSLLNCYNRKSESFINVALQWHTRVIGDGHLVLNLGQVTRLTTELAFPVINITGNNESVVFKVTDSWLACLEFELSATEDPPCREAKRFRESKRSPVGVVLRRGSANSGVVLIN